MDAFKIEKKYFEYFDKYIYKTILLHTGQIMFRIFDVSFLFSKHMFQIGSIR